jgi:hypothetical protein
MTAVDETKKALKFVQDRLKFIKLDTAPPEILYNVGANDLVGDEGSRRQAKR